MHLHLPRIPSVANFAHQVHEVMRHFKHEKESEAHQVVSSLNFYRISSQIFSQIFRQQVGHQPKGFLPDTINPVSDTVLQSDYPLISIFDITG